MTASRALCCSLLLLSSLTAAGCGGRTPATVEDPPDAGSEPEPDAGPEPITTADKLDVLFVVDNSRTGSLAHAALSGTIPYFLDRLVNPRCVNGLGQIVDHPPSLQDECKVGKRDFAPLTDVQLAVISTSLGGHGADTCSPDSPNYHPDQNDAAHLLTRNAGGGVVPSYAGLGFLAWDPNGMRNPPGDDDLDGLEAKLREIVDGVGGRGCGFESQLESFYRFLIDPDPYEEVVVNGGTATPTGTDSELLQQRAAFLRPDSAVLIVLVSDEDDCSTRDGGQFFFSNQTSNGNDLYHLPRPRHECADDPNDACCASCGQATPSGCPASPDCNGTSLTAVEDPVNLRCFDQKRRFGIDFLNPLDRYVDGLKERSVTDRNGNVVANPLFVANRSPALVMLAGIVGVPWQDIAISSTGVGAGFLPSTEIPWQRVLETDGEPPDDPLMIGSRAPRTGTHPVTGDELQPPEASSPNANPINGHEHMLADEVQYACIYELSEPLDCSTDACDCSPVDATGMNPLCQDPATGAYDETQRYGRATPAPRNLQLLQRLGAQAIVGSVCTTSSFDVGSETYGFKPATNAIMRELRRHLEPWPSP